MHADLPEVISCLNNENRRFHRYLSPPPQLYKLNGC
jgi:hypothetical protein